MIALDLDAIKARAEAATPGPDGVEPKAWGWRHFGGDPENTARIVWYPADRDILANPWRVVAEEVYDEADATFIAAARSDIPALVAEVEALRARVLDYENSITWDTTCLNCANLMDQIYALDQGVVPELRAERDALSARIEAALALCDDPPLLVSGIFRDIERWPEGRGGSVHYQPAHPGHGASGCPGDNVTSWFADVRAALSPQEGA